MVGIRRLVITSAAFAARVLPVSIMQSIYANPAVSGWIRTWLNRGLPHGFSEMIVAAGDLSGTRLYLDLEREKDYWLGTYEPELQAAIRRFVKTGMIAYDIGANVGYVALLLARAVGERGKVLAFEALPANIERLRRNVALNDLGETVRVISAAVIDRSRQVRFLIGPSIGTGKAEGSPGRGKEIYQDDILVEGIALDDFVFNSQTPPPDLIKIDIEGGEALALPGMRRVLEKYRPILLMEIHGPESAAVTWEILAEANYKVHLMQSEYPLASEPEDLGWKEYLVAVPEDP